MSENRPTLEELDLSEVSHLLLEILAKTAEEADTAEAKFNAAVGDVTAMLIQKEERIRELEAELAELKEDRAKDFEKAAKVVGSLLRAKVKEGN